MNISFGLTQDALLGGHKTVTRRNWSARTVSSCIKAFNRGMRVHQAWSQCSFVKGAHPIALIEFTRVPYLERLADMPEADLIAEGGLWATKKEFIDLFGGAPQQMVLVIHFRLLP
jgi:hypothetical protein